MELPDKKTPVAHLTSLLSQAKDEGYQNGKKDADAHWTEEIESIKSNHGQYVQCLADEQYEKGRQEAEAKYPNRFNWFLIDFAIFTILLVSFVLWRR